MWVRWSKYTYGTTQKSSRFSEWNEIEFDIVHAEIALDLSELQGEKEQWKNNAKIQKGKKKISK